MAMVCDGGAAVDFRLAALRVSVIGLGDAAERWRWFYAARLFLLAAVIRRRVMPYPPPWWYGRY